MSEQKKKRQTQAKKSEIVTETVLQLTQDPAKRDIVDQTAHKLSQDPVFKRDAVWGVIKFALTAITIANFGIVVTLYVLVKNQTAIHLQKADEQLSQIVSATLIQLTNRISAEFETQRIRETVRAVAEAQAKSLLKQEIQPAIDGFRSEMNVKLSTSSAVVGQLTNTMYFAKTVLSAQNDDRRAFDLLHAWGDDSKHPFQSESASAYLNLLDSHNQLD
ncbi:MAG: hypothetical protein WCS99_22940 [Limisphaerales bacterium]